MVSEPRTSFAGAILKKYKLMDSETNKYDGKTKGHKGIKQNDVKFKVRYKFYLKQYKSTEVFPLYI
jgi:hypothetical protein